MDRKDSSAGETNKKASQPQSSKPQVDCIFCKIVSREIPSPLIYEDEVVVAFKDIQPLAPVHDLIVPRKHHANILDNVSSDILEHVIMATRVLAKSEGVEESGFRLIANTGDDAGQTVKHLHFHLAGGKKLSLEL